MAGDGGSSGAAATAAADVVSAAAASPPLKKNSFRDYGRVVREHRDVRFRGCAEVVDNTGTWLVRVGGRMAAAKRPLQQPTLGALP